MAIGKDIENRGHVVGFKEEITKAAEHSEDSFFTWFDHAADKDAAFVRGNWDFGFHFSAPSAPFVSAPEGLTAMEIGHGGGRVIASAARHFNRVVGVDIHEHNAKVLAELARRGVTNVELKKASGSELPVESASIDFVYSFIVLQHVEKYQVFCSYLSETWRALRPGGLAVLYFGRLPVFSQDRQSPLLYAMDRLAEPFVLWRGYREIPARVNCTNLIISMRHAKSLARRLGFRICASLVSRKKVPDGVRRYGGQHGLILRKPK